MKIISIVFAAVLCFAFILSTPVFAESMLSPVTDTINTGILKTKMMTDSALNNTNVSATVNNGMVAFSGEVDSKAQIDELARLALSVSGIKGVDVSKVKIRSH